MSRFVLVFALIISQSLFSAIVLDVYLVSKRGMGKGLILESELQESVAFFMEEMQLLELANGIQMDLMAVFDNSYKTFGPSEKINVKGRIYNAKGDVINDFYKKGLTLEIGKAFEKNIPDGNDHLLELKIFPHVK